MTKLHKPPAPVLEDGKLHVVDFGKQLVKTGDLDPVYIMLHNAQLPPKLLRQWLLAYWCFYHCGTACWIVSHDYWPSMHRAAASCKYPRSSERRHFRGEFAVKAVKWLEKFPGGIDYMFGGFTEGVQPKSLESVMKYVKTWYGFGDWIAFKVADMLERLDICQVSFTEADTFLFDSPREGAQLVYDKYAVAKQKEYDPAVFALVFLGEQLGHMKAPPRHERRLNGQEYETVLCKWKSHLSGHYHVGKDIREIREGLLRFPRSNLSQKLLNCLPPLVHPK